MKRFIIWILAFVLAFAVAFYQRVGNTSYPLKTVVDTGKQEIQLELPRTHAGDYECELALPIGDILIKGYVEFRKYPTKDSLQRIDFSREGDRLVAVLPSQDVNEKLEYFIFLERGENLIPMNDGKSIVIRFHDEVPNFVMIPYILLLFFGLLLSNATGMFVLFRTPFKKIIVITLVVLFIGGLLFGSIVQKYAFHNWWSGIPITWGLTNNLPLIVMVFWLAAWWFNRRGERPYWIILASATTFLLFLIPYNFL